MKLLIVIVNYRTADLVIDCLRSLAPQVGDAGARVVVVDNASGEISVEKIQRAITIEKWSAWASVLPLDHNGGFAAGNNAAICGSLGGVGVERSEHVLLLNPDTVVRPGCLAAMLRCMDVHPEVGILGPRLEELDGTPQPSARRFPTMWTELDAGARFGPISWLLSDRAMHLPLGDAPQRCDWVSGAAFLVRRAVFEQVGLMDEGYFLYFEEIDFCRRASRAGWQVWHDPTGRVAHLEGQATGARSNPRRPGYWFASRRRWFVRESGVAGLMLADVVFAAARATLVVRQALHLGRRTVGEPRWQAWDTLTSDVTAVITGKARRDAADHASTARSATAVSTGSSLPTSQSAVDIPLVGLASPSIGVVVIGRNEGDRLHRCLESVIAPGRPVVYVDSGSTDASVVLARSMGVEVVELDMSQPFSAARGRNAGFERLRVVAPATQLVQFVDGDCELLPGWIGAATAQLASNPHIAIVAGSLRERSPDASVFNRLCELEWNAAVAPDGNAREVDACGGVFLVRAGDFAAVRGFDASIVAGEEPELCHRLRKGGRSIVRLSTPMATHDAAMIRFSQWWRREVRNGYGSFDVATRFGRDAGSFSAPFAQQVHSAAMWSVGWLAMLAGAVLVAGMVFGIAGVAAALLWGVALPIVQAGRVAVRARRRGTPLGLSCVHGVLTLVAKWAHLVGQNRCIRDRAASGDRRLIEYRAAPAGPAPIPMPASPRSNREAA